MSEAQQPSHVKATRPEQQKNPHDNSDVFDPAKAVPSSPVFQTQPKQGKLSGFDFARDPLNSDRPNQSPDEIVKKESANKPNVMAAQRKLLESKYILEPKLDPQVKMARANPFPSVRPRGSRPASLGSKSATCGRKKSNSAGFSRIRRSLIHCRPTADKYFRKSKSTCSRGSNDSMSISIFPTPSFRNSRPQSS